jgi:hypothetical protein
VEEYPSDVRVRVVQGHRATIAYATYEGGEWPFTYHMVEATGEAIRHPQDKHNPDVAEQLAVGRAVEALARKLLKRANGMVKCADDNAKRERKPEPASDPEPEPAPDHEVGYEQYKENGEPRCQGTKRDGEQCRQKARFSGYCGHHTVY